MTTYLLLALTDDGRVTLRHAFPWRQHVFGVEECDTQPSTEGDDRGRFSTYEVAGYSIDVVRLPEETK